jgi:hypothetical protein
MNISFILYITITLTILALIFISKSSIVPKFTIKNACPSNLGNRRLNPTGWRIMNLAFIVIGLGHTLVHILFFSQMAKISLFFAIIVLISVIISNIGIMIAALVSEDHRFKLHYFGGSLYFAAAGIAGILYLLFSFYCLITQQYWTSDIIGIIILVMNVSLGLFLLRELALNKEPINKRFDLEWYLFLFVELWQAGYFIAFSF